MIVTSSLNLKMFYCNPTLANIKEIALMTSLKFSSAQYS